MEESCRVRRINSEGRGMSASTQEYDMNSKQLLLGTAVATVLALTSPAYAGLLGGAGGGLGGNLGGGLGGGLGGNLGGLGGAGRVGGTGGFDSQGDLTGSVNKKAV